MRYCLGIDGGGTKTEFCLCDEKLNIVREIRLGASNPNDVGIGKTKAILTEGIRECLGALDYSSVYVYAGISGCRTGEYRMNVLFFLREFGFASCECGGDADLSLFSCLGYSDGIAVIMGTGQCVISQNGGLMSFTGGYGYLLDKAGSGFDIGADAIRAAAMAEDGAGPHTLLEELVRQKSGKQSVRSALKGLYKGGKTEIASYASCVFEAVRHSDSAACDILRANVSHICRLIAAALEKFGSKVPVVFCGGLTAHRDILLPEIMTQLTALGVRDKADVSVNGEKMSFSAARIAQILIKDNEI